MPDFLHRAVSGTDLHEAFHYVQTSDPGAVGANLYWLNTTTVPYVLSRRDGTNTSWVAVSYAGASGEITGSDFAAGGLTGAVHATRYAGATTGGAPSSGTWVQGDFVVDYNAKIWICTAGGTPGTWHQSGDAGAIDVTIGGSGLTIATGIKGDIRMPNNDFQIVGWQLYADQSGSIVIDIWKSAHSGFPPTVTNTIVSGGTLPNISAADHSQFVNLTGWTTLVAGGSILRFNVNSVTSITRATLALQVIRL